ncbi:aspartate aminotransferase AspC [Thermoclostridium stercorarium subsp. stercorarium DSM 8532]|jgi:aminotransferase|uniref:Aminotransferase n=3 Tax=Thermoclostridium stercorarium TaxID=1510 RepID=L7VIP0_THES1|nr:aminotransferase class I/II-fold pyridoxal phosphate-dependent enzyme [Thermoclostridium stercorarium]AGC67930.1 aspartate aminotransferase AspC [Thermoclostridium stercorarium subsp. stercorarium DSM 8532]AGI38967.1 aspartate-tyrosine-aromatic aminotransferase [Thermoclostridium stercorarium subsp. stercorarium DSM 8532]ANW98336.1 aromatic amino acid aminotransferase [Thermoclostridium stercorarium subsp. thermolacticum DSM 2910]ANX00863.1 aromatic amino acid aminotransferase [Thermoclostri
MNIQKMIAPHIAAVPPSGIRKYFDLINEMKDAISLGIGEPDFVTPYSIREAGVYSLEKGYTNYSSNAGFIELRREIANYMKRRFSLEYEPETEVLVTVGGSEAIDLAIRTLVSPGDEVIIPEPSFVAYKGCTLFAGAVPVPVELKAENRFRLKREDLEKVVTDKTKVLVIAYPNNPTGAIMEYDDYTEIVDFLKDKEIMIISDELYAELTYTGKHVSIANFEEMKERTVVVNGMSKAFAMTGWRIGFACGNRYVIEQMKKVHQYAIMCAPTTAQYAAIEALRNGEEEVKAMVDEYNRRRRLVLDGFRKIGLECFEPQGAFYVFPDIRKTGLSSDEFCERLLREEKVLMVPGNAFGECGEGFVRATYATSTEKLIEAIKRIGRFVSQFI